MARGKDYTGQKFGKLTFIRKTDKRDSNRKLLWELQCECGNLTMGRASHVISGGKASCGCENKSRAQDWTGQTFYHLMILNKTNQTIRRGKAQATLWEAQCVCGKIILVVPTDVKGGCKRSCGCSSKTGKQDMTGQKIGRLTFISLLEPRKGQTIWKVQCDCGTITPVNLSAVQNGLIKSCGCWFKERVRKYPPMISSARTAYRTYKDGDIDFDTFFALSQLDCFYCECPPCQTFNVNRTQGYNSQEQKEQGDFTYNGLDRVDSSKGHMKDNVVPCCATHNRMKMNMSVLEFVRQCSKVHQVMVERYPLYDEFLDEPQPISQDEIDDLYGMFGT